MKSGMTYSPVLITMAYVVVVVVDSGCASAPTLIPTAQIANSTIAAAKHTGSHGSEIRFVDMRAAHAKLDVAYLAMTTEAYKKAKLLSEKARTDTQLEAEKVWATKVGQSAKQAAVRL